MWWLISIVAIAGAIFGFVVGFIYAEEELRKNKDFTKKIFECRNNQEENK